MGLLVLLALPVWAQSAPTRQVPPSVLDEVRVVESRFELALQGDCDADLCFSKGCMYGEHAVADRPRGGSLPGLAQPEGPSAESAQAYLTRAVCAFTYEPSISEVDAKALAKRLQNKVSRGWIAVSVSPRSLDALPSSVQNLPAATDELPLVPPPPPPAPEPWGLGLAVQQLWNSLLPHAWWMVGLVMLTLASTLLMWAYRRVGKESLEERAMLAELERGEALEPVPDASAEATPTAPVEDTAYAREQTEAWTSRIAAIDPVDPDPELQVLVRELLRAGELELLATAVLHFPETFLAAFPAGGDIASAKLALAEALKTTDAEEHPADAAFFRRFNRYALSASLVAQSDAQVVRSLREDYGAAGLVGLIERLPARAGALLFALGPVDEQREMVRLLSAKRAATLADQLLRSNRMADEETRYLFDVLRHPDAQLPAPPSEEVADRGDTFDAAGALSVLLTGIAPATRSALFARALERFQGTLPGWHKGILTPDMLHALDHEARIDVLLEVEAKALGAWLSLIDRDSREGLFAEMPNSLRASVQGLAFPSRARQLALADTGREALAAAFQRQLERARLPFESVVNPDVGL